MVLNSTNKNVIGHFQPAWLLLTLPVNYDVCNVQLLIRQMLPADINFDHCDIVTFTQNDPLGLKVKSWFTVC